MTTPKERAERIVQDYNLHVESKYGRALARTIERNILAAVEEDRKLHKCCRAEREACAQECDREAVRYRALANGAGRSAAFNGANAAERCGNRIRARGDRAPLPNYYEEADGPPCRNCGLRFRVPLTSEGYCNECQVIVREWYPKKKGKE